MLDFSHLISTLLIVVGGSAGVWGSTEIVMRLSFIPVNQGDTSKVRAVAAVLSAICIGLTSFADRNLETATVQDILVKVLEAVAVFGGSHATHVLLKGADSSEEEE